MVRCGEECVLPRPFSIHRVNEDSIALFFNVWEDGTGTVWLWRRDIGDRVDIIGPLGNGFLISPDSKNLLLVAGGIGTAPFNLLIKEALRSKCSVTLLLGVQTKAQLYPRRLLPPEVKVIIATEDGTTGKKGMVTELIPDFAGETDQIFACGPLTMYRDMTTKYPQLTNKSVQISLEIMMACGRGLCYGCSIKTKSGMKKVCQDGPVFDLKDILWDELNLL